MSSLQNDTTAQFVFKTGLVSIQPQFDDHYEFPSMMHIFYTNDIQRKEYDFNPITSQIT